MEKFVKAAQVEQELKWAKIWFKQFSAFHQRHGQTDWEFNRDDVIRFLQSDW